MGLDNRELAETSSKGVEASLAELRALIARHARPDLTTAIDRVLLSAATGPTEPTASTSGTVMALIAQGTKQLAIGDRVYVYEPGQYLVASVDLPITGHYVQATESEPALGFGLVLRPSTISSLLLDAVEHAPVLARRAWRLIAGPLGESVRQIGLADSSLTHISHAVRWVTEHYNESFLVGDLARSCGMSTSAFHRNFQAVTGLSPIQFQKQIRLQQSRLMLMTGADDVATIAYRVGYDGASQFNREYRRQFGLSPGRDGARLRAQAVSA
jgi:AraC-like DNA-binding protein